MNMSDNDFVDINIIDNSKESSTNKFSFNKYKPWKILKNEIFSFLYICLNIIISILIILSVFINLIFNFDKFNLKLIYYTIILVILVAVASSSLVDGLLNSIISLIYRLGHNDKIITTNYSKKYHILISYMLKANIVDDINKTFESIKASINNVKIETVGNDNIIIDIALVSGTTNKFLVELERKYAIMNNIIYFSRNDSNLKKLGQIIDLVSFLHNRDMRPRKYLENRNNLKETFKNYDEIKVYFEGKNTYPEYIYVCDYDTVLTSCSIIPIINSIEKYQDSYTIYQPEVIFAKTSSIYFDRDLTKEKERFNIIKKYIEDDKTKITIFQKRQIDLNTFSDESLFVWDMIFKYSRFTGKGLINVSEYYKYVIEPEIIPDFVLSHDTIETLISPICFVKDSYVLEECIPTVSKKVIQLIRWTMGEIKNIYLVNVLTRYTIFLIPHLLFYRKKLKGNLKIKDYKAKFLFLKNISQHFGICIISLLALLGLLMKPILNLEINYLNTLCLQIFLLIYPIIKNLLLINKRNISISEIYSFIELSLLYTPIISVLSIFSFLVSFVFVFINKSFWITSSSEIPRYYNRTINLFSFSVGVVVIFYCLYMYKLYNYIESYIYWYFGFVNLISPLYLSYLSYI